MKWLVDNDARDGYEGLRAGSGIILVGHSVGATIAFAVALGLHEGREEKFKGPRERIKSVVGVEGVYDFTALRDAHAGFRDVYEEFTKGVFGDERHGGWEEGNIVRMVREGGEMDRVEVVVLGQSREDELVEWGQVEMMEETLRGNGWCREGQVEEGGKEVMAVELKGGHDEIWERGGELARCVRVAVERCVRRCLGSGS